FSGSIEMDGQKIVPSSFSKLPEETKEKAKYFNKPYVFWFADEPGEIDYDIAFTPDFKKPGRGLASAGGIEDIVVQEVEEVEVEDFDKVKGKIWVHDIVYDEAVRTLENAAYEKARQLIPVAVKEASQNLVWDVASRSVLKWGVQFAKKTSQDQVPVSVAGSYLGERDDQFNFYDKNLYREATEEIARLRSYRAAKVAVLKYGYEKGWREAKAYAEKMIPLIVKPIVMVQVQEYALPLGIEAVDEVIKKSNLKKTKDVDKLLTHLSQVISEKVTLELINKYAPYYTKSAAQVAAKEAARSSAEEVAQFMAKDSSERAGDLIIKLLARERGRRVAREIASEAKRTEALSAKRKAQTWQDRSQR
ncbi:MAG: hypothetical protein NXH75_18400, partial [Halobacteriovoraceae bacterium]|nr:hypothetical protein [Halobacteriovoraceae bacterium]